MTIRCPSLSSPPSKPSETLYAGPRPASVAAFAAAGLRDNVTIMIGGGPVNSDLARQLGADGAGTSAQDAVILAGKAVEGGAS